MHRGMYRSGKSTIGPGHLSPPGLALFPMGDEAGDEELDTPTTNRTSTPNQQQRAERSIVAPGAVSLADRFPGDGGGGGSDKAGESSESGTLAAAGASVRTDLIIKRQQNRKSLQDTKSPPAHLLKGTAGRTLGVSSPNERSRWLPTEAAVSTTGGIGSTVASRVATVGGQKDTVTTSGRELLEVIPSFRSEQQGSDEVEQSQERGRESGQVEETGDLQAARSTRCEKLLLGEIELHRHHSPAEWMTVGHTMGISTLWYTFVFQVAVAITSTVYLSSAAEDQLLWRTGCWGEWTSMPDTEGVDWVTFETHVGWRSYGKRPKLEWLADVDRSTAVVGALSGGMHGIIVVFTIGFLLYLVAALLLSYVGSPPGGRVVVADGYDGQKLKHESKISPVEVQRTDPNDLAERVRRLAVGRTCHRWMISMGIIMIFAGLWCFAVGCLAFYLMVTTDFTRRLEATLSVWGENVSCAEPETRPRYGFFANGLAIYLLITGGTVCLMRGIVSERDLSEAVVMWKIDQNEMAEMRVHANMVRKKEEYAKATKAAAAAAINGNTPSIAKHTRDNSAETTSDGSTWSYSTASQSLPQQHEPHESPGLPRPPASPRRTPQWGGTPHGGISSPRGVVQSPPRDQQQPQQVLDADASPKQRFSTESAVCVSDSAKISQSRPSAHKRAVSQSRGEVAPLQIVLPSSAEEAVPQQLIPQAGGGHRSSKSRDLRPNDAVSPPGSPGAEESELMGIIHEEQNEDEEDNDSGDGDGHLPLPPTLAGWDERSTPSGEMFWVNNITKDVSWDRPR